MRKFHREYPDAEIVESKNPSHDLPILFDLMEKDDAKKSFLTENMKTFFTAIVSALVSHTSLLYITLGDKYLSSTLSFIFNGTYYLYNSGFDKDCCANAGFFLKEI